MAVTIQKNPIKTGLGKWVVNQPSISDLPPNPETSITTNGYTVDDETEFDMASLPPNTSIYGWRDVLQTNEDGVEELVRIPLTLEDYLHPQEGDKHMNNSDQARMCFYLKSILTTYITSNPPPVIYNEVGMDWNIPNEGHYAPDISIIYNVDEPERYRSVFKVADEGTQPSLVIEVTSPSTRHVDFGDKFQAYERVGVPYYIIVDSRVNRRTKELVERRVIGYELTPNGYVAMTPNEYGWIWMEPAGLWIGLDGTELQCYDAQGNHLRNQRELLNDLNDSEEQLADASERLAESEERLVETSYALAMEREAKEAERAEKERLANYLRSLGLDPDNLP